MKIEILTDPDAIMPFHGDIVALANKQTGALGFLPKKAYEEAIDNHSIHVAIVQEPSGISFAGHIWLGGRRPAKKVVQVVVCDKYRRESIGKKLLQYAVSYAKEDGFYTISAKVGESLPANRFWEKQQGFTLVGKVPGKSTHPICNIWEKALTTDLFNLPANSPDTNGLTLKRAIENVKTDLTLVLDANVFINACKGAEDARSILNRGQCGQINILHTSATTNELRKYRGDDCAIKFALQTPESSASSDNAVVEELREMIFPAKILLTEQDKSDLESLAITIASGIPIFVTGDKEILREARKIYKRFSLEVLHPSALCDKIWFDGKDGYASTNSTMATTENGFRFVLNPNKAKMKHAGYPDVAGENRKCVALQGGEDILGIISVDNEPKIAQQVSLYVKNGDDDEYVADALLGWLRREITGKFLPIELTPCMGKNAARNALLSHGYINSPPEIIYRKMNAAQVVMQKNWKTFRSHTSLPQGMELSDNIPVFCRYNQPIEISPSATVPLNKLEDYLSSVFILPGRDGVVMPIKKWFAERFFDHSRQRHLFSASAELLGHKSYLGTTQAKSRLQAGIPILFYQSKEKTEPGKIVAIARIVRTQIIDTEKMSDTKKRHLALTPEDTKKLKNPALETVFDNCVILTSSVTLDELRRMKCDDPTNFVTATHIDYKKMSKILKKGFPT